MAVGKEDVLMILEDPNMVKIDFSLGGLHIHAEAFRKVAAAIRSGRIGILVGESPKWAKYFIEPGSIKRPHGVTDKVPSHTLVLQKTRSLDLNDRALIVHECAHAYLDVSLAVETTVLSSEVASYVAQVLFLMANGKEPDDKFRTPLDKMFVRITDFIKEFDLNSEPGRGKVVPWKDYEPLRGMVSAIHEYRKIEPMALVFSKNAKAALAQ